MALATIESSVRAMMTSNATLIAAVPAARISHGYRLQDGVLPAITFELQSVEMLSFIGDVNEINVRVHRASAEITVIAATTNSALLIGSTLNTACAPGTFGGIVFDAVLWNGHQVTQSVAGEGDEQQPAELVASVEIYYRT